MTISTASRATLQDVLTAIDTAPDVTGKRKQDLRSAVRLTAKLLGQAPHDVAADPRGLGRRLDSVSGLSLGLSVGRWANVRSLLRSALSLSVPVMAGASAIDLLPDWQALLAEARKVGSCAIRLGRLMRWLSEHGVTPESVTLQDIEEYRNALLTDALLGRPEQSWAATRQSWERMRVAYPAWPQIELVKPSNPMTYSLPWETYPESLKADVDRYLDHLAGNTLSEEGPARPLRPATLKLRKHELRSFATALVKQGVEPQSLTSLTACLTLDHYKLGLRWFHVRDGSKPSATLHNMAASLRLIARHWVIADETTLSSMSKVVSKLAPPPQAMSDKNRDRLRPFDDPEQQQVILNLPEKIRRHVETTKSARARQTGLSTAAMAIEILVNVPLRLGNLCQLHLDRNFIKAGKKTHLCIPRQDVKNGVALEFVLPDETVAVLDWYITHYRKVDPENRYLFAGEGGSHKVANTLRSQIMETVKTFTGLTVHPHLFRSIAGSLYLDANPGDVETLRQVLGHKSINTTARFYAAHMARKAQQHFTDTVRKLREASHSPTADTQTAKTQTAKTTKRPAPPKKRKS